MIAALGETAARITGEAHYRWTQMGACNCGHLAQTVTRLPRAEIQRRALERAGDWSEQAVEHCAASGLPMDHVFESMLAIGLEVSDIPHLERLSDPRVLRRLPLAERSVDFRQRADVVRYLEAWQGLLEDELASASSGVRRLDGVGARDDAERESA